MTISLDFITTRFACSAAPSTQEDVAYVASLGITHVVDVTDALDDTPEFASHPLVSVLWNPTPDDGEHKSPLWFQKSLQFALPSLILSATKVLFHCSAGINRGPSTCLAAMLALGWDGPTATDLIHKCRPTTLAGIRYAQDAETAVRTLGYV